MYLVIIGFILGGAVVAFINGKTMDRMEKEIDDLKELVKHYEEDQPPEYDPTKFVSITLTKH